MRNPQLEKALSGANDAAENISDKLDFLTYDNSEPTPQDALKMIDQMLDSKVELEAHLLNLRAQVYGSILVAEEGQVNHA